MQQRQFVRYWAKTHKTNQTAKSGKFENGRTALNGGITMTNFNAIISRLTENTSDITVVTDVKTQRQQIEDAAPTTWTEFKTYLSEVNYVLTPTKRVLCDVGGMTAADYARLTNLLDVVRACIIDWQSSKMRLDDTELSKAKRKEIAELCENKRSAVYAAIKGIKSVFDIDTKSKPTDIDWLASRVVTIRYRDRTNIKLGYTLSVSGNMAILSNIFKLVSASHDGQTALENAQAKLIKKNAGGIKSAIAELTDLETAEAAQLETAKE